MTTCSLGQAELPRARAQGFLAWWTSPHLYAQFMRPLASLSHSLEFSAYPSAAWLMHLHNALLYAALIAVAALLYRRLAGSALAAGLAALLFAIDDGHAFSVGWIAGRNTLLAALFSLLSLWFHDRARTRGGRASLLLTTLSVALALSSAEAGVGSLTLLVSYALVLDAGSARERLMGLIGPLSVGALWAAAYVGLGYGFRGSSFYRDPSAPLTMLGQGVLDLPLWLVDALGPSGVPAALLFPTLWSRLGALPVAALFLWLLWPALKTRESRFFACAFGLSLAPLLSTLPAARVLIVPSFGALGWVASAIAEAHARSGARACWTEPSQVRGCPPVPSSP